MSSWWTERQGRLGDLGSRSREELQEILSRQEKILLNQKFIQTLPDKGKKISDFVEKVRQALAALEEEEEKKAGLSSIATEFQARYQQALAQRRRVERGSLKGDPGLVKAISTNPSEDTSRTGDAQQDPQPLSEPRAELMEASSGERAEALAEALEQVTLSGEKICSLKDTESSSSPRNPFSVSQSQKKPHYIEVLERSSASAGKHRFKPNQRPESSSTSPGHSPGQVTPISAEARRQRDRKHLDDITAAKLPPLHHSPAQLLSLEESVTLLQEQTRKQQEMQAKFAAQKLAEGLAVGMSSNNPEGGALGAYREVHDEEALSDVD